MWRSPTISTSGRSGLSFFLSFGVATARCYCENNGYSARARSRLPAAIPMDNPYRSCKPTESRLTAAIPMDNPCCSCELTRHHDGRKFD